MSTPLEETRSKKQDTRSKTPLRDKQMPKDKGKRGKMQEVRGKKQENQINEETENIVLVPQSGILDLSRFV